MEIGIPLLISFVLVLVHGFFSLSEAALLNAKLLELEKQAESGDVKARRAAAMVAQPEKALASIQAAIILTGLFAAVVAALCLSGPLSSWLISFDIGWLSYGAPVVSMLLITLLVSYFCLVVGEFVPRRAALAHAEAICKSVAGSLQLFCALLKPLVWLTTLSAKGLSALFGIRETDERQGVSEEEIKSIVKDNEELLDDEKRMIHDILNLGDMTVREVMQPRVDMIFVEDVESVRQAVERMRGTGYSRLPVYHEDYDSIVGIVHYKDLVAPMLDGKGDEPVGLYAYEALFVPETKDVYPLLSEMQTNRQQMAIVVDEYGGTDGLITVEDILEEIVGEIGDETDVEDGKFVSVVGEGEWVIDGRLPVDEAVELGLPVTDSDDYETIAGWLMNTIDVVPQMGDEFEVGGYKFKVQAMRRRRISTIRVSYLGDKLTSCKEDVEMQQESA